MPTDENAQVPFTEATVTEGFAGAEFADNPEPRCPCLLLLDNSASMNGAPIEQLNAGLQTLKDDLVQDPLAAKRVEVAVVSFGGAPALVSDFVNVASFEPPVLTAQGETPMGAAIVDGLARLAARKETYRHNGITYYRPWVFLITDGAPTDTYELAATSVCEGDAAGKFSFFAVGVRGANMATLARIAPPARPPVQLDGLRFADLFRWLSKSMKTVSQTVPGATVSLIPPGWISAST